MMTTGAHARAVSDVLRLTPPMSRLRHVTLTGSSRALPDRATKSFLAGRHILSVARCAMTKCGASCVSNYTLNAASSRASLLIVSFGQLLKNALFYYWARKHCDRPVFGRFQLTVRCFGDVR